MTKKLKDEHNIDIADGSVDITHYLEVQRIAIDSTLNAEMLRRRISNFLLDLNINKQFHIYDFDSYTKLCELLEEMCENETYKKLDVVLND